jgi:TolB-like protein/class 3 adenylate cyclase
MAGARVERRLAAILAADVAGYSRLMGVDEEGTLVALKAHLRELVEPKIAEHRGRIVKTTGDGVLVEFASAVDAVRCAIEIQRSMVVRNDNIPDSHRIEFRIGINIGDTILDEGDIYGDGVNIAARLENLAEPGSICLSDIAYQQTRGKIGLDADDMGEQQLKNIAQPVRAYIIRLDGAPARPALALPEKPSIAVLAFTNMSGDPEQEYFADGMVEDIIAALSRFKELFVIARNSSFIYKGRAVDIKQVGRELGVRYVLEGSVRKAANQLRISVQLIDALTGAHLWADRFEGTVGEVFDLQDRVAAIVAGAIAPTLHKAEIDRARRKPPTNLESYDYLLRALPYVIANSPSEAVKAIPLLSEALRLDPNYAYAHGLLAISHGIIFRSAAGEKRQEAERLGTEHARKAVALGQDDSAALTYGGFTLLIVEKNIDGARAALDKAVALNRNSAIALAFRSMMLAMVDEPQAAIDDAMSALRLSPFDTLNYLPPIGIAIAQIYLNDYAEAATWAKKASEINSRYPMGYFWAIVAECGLGNRLEAEAQFDRLKQILPHLQPDDLPNVFNYFPKKLQDRISATLRGAGFITPAECGAATNARV